MRVLIAPDSFKGSLSAPEAAQCIREGWQKVFPEAEFDLAPLADGGEGTVTALVQACGGSLRYADAHDALGRPLRAAWGVLPGLPGSTDFSGLPGSSGSPVPSISPRCAVIEVAEASGLTLIKEDERDLRRASSFGSGEVFRAALEFSHAEHASGAAAHPPHSANSGLPKTELPSPESLRPKLSRPRLIVGLGGSATNDGGSGLLRALGLRLLDASGAELPPNSGGAALARLAKIDASGLHPLLARTEILVACDVQNPLCGPQGASLVFGPQKDPKLTEAELWELDAALARFARLSKALTGRDVAEQPGAGAAGGLGAGLLFYTPARLLPGAELMLESINFSARAARADLVITGEGRTDAQTLMGKAPFAVARAVAGLAPKIAAEADQKVTAEADLRVTATADQKVTAAAPGASGNAPPVICISGSLGQGAEGLLQHGISALHPIVAEPCSLRYCMENAAALLRDASERAARLMKTGMRIKE